MPPPLTFQASLLKDEASPPFLTYSKFGHMSTLYRQDQKKFSKFELDLSYTTCDKVIKIPPS